MPSWTFKIFNICTLNKHRFFFLKIGCHRDYIRKWKPGFLKISSLSFSFELRTIALPKCLMNKRFNKYFIHFIYFINSIKLSDKIRVNISFKFYFLSKYQFSGNFYLTVTFSHTISTYLDTEFQLCCSVIHTLCSPILIQRSFFVIACYTHYISLHWHRAPTFL
jgi:hypothetical protein